MLLPGPVLPTPIPVIPMPEAWELSALHTLQAALMLSGCAFFALGTLGLFRLPDSLTRLHALTKVDNLGLGLIVLGLLPSVTGLATGGKLLLVWLVALQASATAAHLVAARVAAASSPPGKGTGSDD